MRGVHADPTAGGPGPPERDDDYRDAIRAVHLGERLDEGVVTWSGNTLDKALALFTARTTDAVATFLEADYVDRTLREIQAQAGHPVADPQEAARTGSQRLRFSDEQQAGILAISSAAATSPRRDHAGCHQHRADPARW